MRRIFAVAALSASLLMGLGHRAAADDMLTVGDLLQYCHASTELCGQAFSGSAINMAFLWGGNCIPANVTRQQTRMAVLRWLSGHRDLVQEDAPDGIADAVSALWPCGTP